MAARSTLLARMAYRIKSSAVPVFVPGDFLDLSDRNQVGRVLRAMTKSGVLIKIGHGIYARAKVSKKTGRKTLERPLHELAAAALKKRGVTVAPSSADEAYRDGKTTQIPTGRVIGVTSRISRKIGYGGVFISFERRLGQSKN